jgi:hypothetical protein
MLMQMVINGEWPGYFDTYRDDITPRLMPVIENCTMFKPEQRPVIHGVCDLVAAALNPPATRLHKA